MMTLFGTSDLARTIAEGKPCVLNDNGELVKVEEMLLQYFEPYANLSKKIFSVNRMQVKMSLTTSFIK